MILILNAGSSSIKVKLFAPDLTEVLSGRVTEIGGSGELILGDRRGPVSASNHANALERMLRAMEEAGVALADLTAVGHRIVHGGETLTAPAELTDEVIGQITACIPLAPLHNPNNLAGVAAMKARLPDVRQFCSFGTAFHATNPDVAVAYAIPAEARADGIRRYGFHGLSYAGMVAGFGGALPARLLALHLGNGASLCAIHNGQSMATSMGYSPLEGLTMGTRSGTIDGAAVLRLAAKHGAAETDRMLNKDSGLKGLAGESDMRALLARDDDAARFAVAHFCYWAARHAGSAIVAMGGVDAIAFTGGIGENAAPVRARILEHLAFLGELPVHVIKAEEEKQIARDVVGLMG